MRDPGAAAAVRFQPQSGSAARASCVKYALAVTARPSLAHRARAVGAAVLRRALPYVLAVGVLAGVVAVLVGDAEAGVAVVDLDVDEEASLLDHEDAWTLVVGVAQLATQPAGAPIPSDCPLSAGRHSPPELFRPPILRSLSLAS